MSKPVILTGLRANNDLTIGNYLGALLPLIDMAKKRAGEYQVNLFVPDLHSFTTPIDHSTLYAQVLQNLKVFIAAGLPVDHEDVYVYRQSFIPAHSELTWILDCFTGFGEMSRMTQFKDKSLKLSAERISVGLFNYPVLMAADILLYNTSYVPVGDDQTQHLEFARDIAERMNNQFGALFAVPLPVAKQHEFFGNDQGLRIRDLLEPTKKMSKSDETGRGVIFLTDSPEVATKKIMSATTDSFGEIQFDMKERPGISNLLQMLALLSGRAENEVIAEWRGQTQYGDLKKAVATVVGEFLKDFQAKLAAVSEQDLLAKLESSEKAMNVIASETLRKAQHAVGLRGELTSMIITTTEEQRGKRLDVLVALHMPRLSRAFVQKLCDNDKVLVNGVGNKSGYRIKPGDVITVDYDEAELDNIPVVELPIIYEDDDCIVINKPAGILTHAQGALSGEATVASFIRTRLSTDGVWKEDGRAGIVHRLDRATSGVIIGAKSQEALSFLQKQFSVRKVKKTYIAVAEGHFKQPEAIVDMPIERNPKAPATFRVGANGKPSITHYKILKEGEDWSVVELKPETGRTHQLRVHLAQLGHPIIGDSLYGHATYGDTLYLHAASLEITLPNRERRTFTAPLPAVFSNYITL